MPKAKVKVCVMVGANLGQELTLGLGEQTRLELKLRLSQSRVACILAVLNLASALKQKHSGVTLKK